MEIKNIARCAFMTPDTKLITIDLAQIERNQAARREEMEKSAPPPSQADFRKEYNQLRQRLFDLQQNAKCFEIRTNEAAGKIRNLEERINEALKLKKAAVDAGNLRGERMYERQVLSLESEMLDLQEDFAKNKQWSVQSARALKAFDGHGRIAELKAILESPVVK
jgi:hypothetical protein